MNGTGLKVRLANQLSEIEPLAEAVEAFCEEHGVPPQSVFHLNLVLDELITNIVSYGYDDEDPHEIEVRLELSGDRLTAEVVDDGRPFDPLSAPPPDLDASLEDRAIGGLGVHFLRTLMQDVEYRRNGGLNQIRFTKNLSAPAETDR